MDKPILTQISNRQFTTPDIDALYKYLGTHTGLVSIESRKDGSIVMAIDCRLRLNQNGDVVVQGTDPAPLVEVLRVLCEEQR